MHIRILCGVAVLLVAAGEAISLPAQEPLAVPEGVAAAQPLPAPSAAAEIPHALPAHPPVPSLLQTLTAAKRGLCTKWRESALCKLVGKVRKPLSSVTGGLVPAEKKPHPEEHAKPGPQGTAAQIQSVKIEAPKRQGAVQSLAGVDVRYHPEAEATLIGALRADPSECVRLQAAETIATLPVCSPPLLKALQVCIEGSNIDGNPAELSPRVRRQASLASAHCQTCSPELTPPAAERPEYPDSMVAPAVALVPSQGDSMLDLPISRTLAASQQDGGTLALIDADLLDANPLTRFSPPPSATAIGRSMETDADAANSPRRQAASSPAPPRNLLDVFRAASRD